MALYMIIIIVVLCNIHRRNYRVVLNHHTINFAFADSSDSVASVILAVTSIIGVISIIIGIYNCTSII